MTSLQDFIVVILMNRELTGLASGRLSAKKS